MDPSLYQPPVAPKQPRFSRRIIFIGLGLVAAILIAVVLMVASSGGNKNADLYARAVARQEVLLNLIDEAESDITSSTLSKINIDAKLFVSSDLHALKTDLPKLGLKEVPKEIAALEADTTSKAELDEALIQNRFEQVYIEMLIKKIDAQQALLSELYGKLPTSATKEKVKAAYDKLKSLQVSLEKL